MEGLKRARERALGRARDMVERMSVEECASQLLFESRAVPSEGIPAYNWWNEALHGVARAGLATVFPQAIGLAASFDPEGIRAVADAIASEGRAKYHAFCSEGDRGIYKGITFWSPNVNIFRDPRWGRGQETYGEDPFLTAELGAAFVRGLQGDDPQHLKAAACAKHFAVHSGPEGKRHEFNAVVSAKDLEESYLPAFRRLVSEGVEGVMGAYNRVNGEPCCGSKSLLRDILVDQWGFDGYVTSDCWAIADFHLHHRVTANALESIALALRQGCHLNCGSMYAHMLDALEAGLVTEELIREAAARLLSTRIRLGMFGEPSPYALIPYAVVDCEEHRKLNFTVACKSLVLLRNDGLLPLDPGELRSVAVIGPNADSVTALEGNYHGTAGQYHTVLSALQATLPDTRITYSMGCQLYRRDVNDPDYGGSRLSEVRTHCRLADLVVLVVGLDASIEGEEMTEIPGFSGSAGDREGLLLPESQRELVDTVMGSGRPVVVVNMSGGAVDLLAGNNANAVIQAWYPGAMGGKAICDVILGRCYPSGRLPVTFYRESNTLPDFEDYNMEGRTYRFLDEQPLYPFGFGLSYTTFSYSDLRVKNSVFSLSADGSAVFGEGGRDLLGIDGSVVVRNTGERDGEEVIQFYIRVESVDTRVPRHALCGTHRVGLTAGEEKRIFFSIPVEALEIVDDAGRRCIESGVFTLFAGGCQPDPYSEGLLGRKCVSASLVVDTIDAL